MTGLLLEGIKVLECISNLFLCISSLLLLLSLNRTETHVNLILLLRSELVLNLRLLFFFRQDGLGPVLSAEGLLQKIKKLVTRLVMELQ